MPYLIDGHNLIPKIPGLSLDTWDDEQQLIQMLQEFCRRQRKQAEVFFDNAPPDGVRVRKFGPLVARFVRQGTTADAAIHSRLERLGREARNWTVVSSDQAVQSSARSSRAQTLSSDTFARHMLQTLEGSGGEAGKSTDVALSNAEVDDWLKIFGDKNTGE